MKSKTPDHTAVRVALWRALHARLDPEPLVLRDELGAALVGEAKWWERPDMQAGFSHAEYVSADDLYLKYFAGRPDGLRAGSAEAFLIAKP